MLVLRKSGAYGSCISRQFPNRLPASCIQLRTGLGSDVVAPGEFTKRWQDSALVLHHKAWQAQAVAPRALQLHRRMQMTRQNRMGGVMLRMVACGKRADQIRLVHHADVEIFRRVASAAVVVAADQCANHVAVAVAPGLELTQHRCCPGMVRMQKVTQKDQLRGLIAGNEASQSPQVFSRGAAGHGLAQRTVRGGLAHVKVGNEQHAAFRPPQRVFRQQPHAVASVSYGQMGHVSGAWIGGFMGCVGVGPVCPWQWMSACPG